MDISKDLKHRLDDSKKLIESQNLKYELLMQEKNSLEKKIFSMNEEIKDGKSVIKSF